MSDTDELPRYEKDGMVAVLVSTGLGRGWSTWNKEIPGLVFDPEIVSVLLESGKSAAVETIRRKYDPDDDCSIIVPSCLEVVWVPKGTVFAIHGYYGAESVVIIGPDTSYVA